ncbi:MAG: D-glycero-beta-D-manno-heptose 1-phosphate adenylyltransferase [Candidatus Krumholzibacteriota bacterium]|nr:D-glycero-beta-D-manno-heptose 1-phosphate adenylyltransferase [Candidatus Krumholzibacteriota bacterium]
MISEQERVIVRGRLARFRKENSARRIVFTNGCFDILHRGHVTLLEKAREMGDILVVGVNSDRSIRRLGKGKDRPVVEEKDRVFMLLSLRAVDYVTIFDEDTPLETIEALSPDILVKGDEYPIGDIVGADFMEKRGGKVERIKMVEGLSTSRLIDKMREGS